MFRAGEVPGVGTAWGALTAWHMRQHKSVPIWEYNLLRGSTHMSYRTSLEKEIIKQVSRKRKSLYPIIIQTVNVLLLGICHMCQCYFIMWFRSAGKLEF